MCRNRKNSAKCSKITDDFALMSISRVCHVGLLFHRSRVVSVVAVVAVVAVAKSHCSCACSLSFFRRCPLSHPIRRDSAFGVLRSRVLLHIYVLELFMRFAGFYINCFLNCYNGMTKCQWSTQMLKWLTTYEHVIHDPIKIKNANV